MSLFSKRNQYLGVNAHASSWLQNREGEWVSFHHDHITDLTRGLNAILPEGYEARSEHSLQIREITPRSDAPAGKPNGHNTARSRYPQPDTTIYKTRMGQLTSDSMKTAAQPTQAIVTDPRPSVKAGRTEIYAFDTALPIDSVLFNEWQ